jgi:hypothetical protein
MPNTRPTHSSQNVFLNQEKPRKTKTAHGDLRQDKRATITARIPSPQPARSSIPLRAKPLDTKTTRVQNPTVDRRRTVQLTLWVSPIEKAEIQRRAERENLSVSSVGAALVRKGMQTDLDLAYGALLEPVFASLLNRHMESRDNRLALLLVRNYLVGEQTRGLVTNLLGRHPAITPEVLNNILDHSFQEAKKKLIRRSPELEALIKEVKSWVVEEERGEAKKRKEPA